MNGLTMLGVYTCTGYCKLVICLILHLASADVTIWIQKFQLYKNKRHIHTFKHVSNYVRALRPLNPFVLFPSWEADCGDQYMTAQTDLVEENMKAHPRGFCVTSPSLRGRNHGPLGQLLALLLCP